MSQRSGKPDQRHRSFFVNTFCSTVRPETHSTPFPSPLLPALLLHLLPALLLLLLPALLLLPTPYALLSVPFFPPTYSQPTCGRLELAPGLSSWYCRHTQSLHRCSMVILRPQLKGTAPLARPDSVNSAQHQHLSLLNADSTSPLTDSSIFSW